MWTVRCQLCVVLAAAVLLVPWPAAQQQQQQPPACSRCAAGQGLSVSQEQLGAGEVATASQFQVFEDSLTISNTGGRGRGGRGGSGNLGSAAFTDAERLAEMQLGIYNLASAPSSYPSCQHKDGRRRSSTARRTDCNNYIPNVVRDQKSCSTCVSQSVATAIQMAAAAAMEADVDAWEVSAASLYYCSEGEHWLRQATHTCNSNELVLRRLAVRSCLCHLHVLVWTNESLARPYTSMAMSVEGA